MRIYVMSYDYGDGSAGVAFYKRKPEEDDLESYQFESMMAGIRLRD